MIGEWKQNWLAPLSCYRLSNTNNCLVCFIKSMSRWPTVILLHSKWGQWDQLCTLITVYRSTYSNTLLWFCSPIVLNIGCYWTPLWNHPSLIASVLWRYRMVLHCDGCLYGTRLIHCLSSDSVSEFPFLVVDCDWFCVDNMARVPGQCLQSNVPDSWTVFVPQHLSLSFTLLITPFE